MCSTAWSTRSRRGRAGRWSCAGIRAWARAPCWVIWPSGPTVAGWRERPACSPRWSWPSPACTNCARRCWATPNSCPLRNGTRCGPRSGSAPGRRRTASWSGWPCLACCRKCPGSSRWSASSTTSSGWATPRARPRGLPARRLGADPVGLVFAARSPGNDQRAPGTARTDLARTDLARTERFGDELAGLPELAVTGLREDDARALLDSALTGPLDAQVRDLIVAETHGSPLALLELPRGLSPAELAGGFGLPGAAALPNRIEDSFRAQLAT